MAYYYQNDAYHSRLFENYKSKLVEQKQQNKSESQSQNLAIRSKQIAELKKSFTVSEAPKLIDVGDIDREDYFITFESVKNKKQYNIRLQLDYEFPVKKPKFYLEKKYSAYYVNSNTFEINYNEFFPWNSNKSALVELVRNIQDMLAQSPLEFCDTITQTAESCASQINHTSRCLQLNQLTLEKIFPNVQEHNKESQYNKFAQLPQQINQNIKATVEYSELLKSCAEKTDMLRNVAQEIKDTYKDYNQVKVEVANKQEQFKNKLQEYFHLHGELKNIEQRFEIQAAQAILDCEIQKLEDSIAEVMKDRFSDNLEQSSRKYKSLKQQQLYLQLLKQQYLKSN